MFIKQNSIAGSPIKNPAIRKQNCCTPSTTPIDEIKKTISMNKLVF